MQKRNHPRNFKIDESDPDPDNHIDDDDLVDDNREIGNIDNGNDDFIKPSQTFDVSNKNGLPLFSFISTFLRIILFLPKILIYIPIYYIYWIISYPFRKIYQLTIYIFSTKLSHHSDHSEFSDSFSDGKETEKQFGYPETDNKRNDNSITDSDSNNATNTPSPSPSSKGTSKYSPKSSISTILEESIEFDPDYHENDDYFKSPSDSNPIKPSIKLLDDENILDDTPNSNQKNISKLNYKLSQAVNNSTSSLNDDDVVNTNQSSSSLSSSRPKSEPSNIKSLSPPISTSSSSSTIVPLNQNLTSTPQQTKRKKKKKFVFPKLLFDFNIMYPPKLPKKTLVLDLDETLIHSLSRYNSSTLNKTKGRSIEVKVSGGLPTLYHIYKRPYVEEFLAVVYQWFDLVCFTASIKEYADPTIDYLEEQVLSHDVMKKQLKKLQLDPPKKIFKSRYYRNSCIFVESKGYLKDLSVVISDDNRLNNSSSSQSRSNSRTRSRSRASSISSNVSKSNNTPFKMDFSKIIIIDNSPISYVRHKDNGLMIEGWINDPDDSELLNLLPLLNSLRFVSDVRCVLGLKNGQRAFK